MKFRLILGQIVVTALVLSVLFFQLGERGLNEPDEGQFVEIGREIAVTGDYLTPRLNGTEHFSRPSITYWPITLSLKICSGARPTPREEN